MPPRTPPDPQVLTREEWEARERLQKLAWLLDSSIPVPGTPFTIGLDALIGLVPVIGDLIGVLLSSYIVAEAARLGAGRSILARMTFNVAVEGLGGMVPFAGDIFDAAWKANQRNVRLLSDYLEHPRRATASSRWFIAGMFLIILGVTTGIVLLGIYLWSLL